ncbi:MAG: type I-E CRISPR-associated endoribonuclease Cas2 [Chloroflexi bacterium]|nr:MAG: type I-E CRISPR-associated endoribonuclease Cas2 [Chloroflexota bacterium]
MVVMVLERVTPSLRGELTRWMLEPKAGVFVGDMSALVRERLWEHICKQVRDGGAMLIHSTDTEQSFALRLHGDTTRSVVDYDGLQLIRIPAN